MGSNAMRKNKMIDMTGGSIVRCLVMFALPVIFGDVFQKLYNTVDAWVVGNFVSDEAFSAIGGVTPIINLIINTFFGFSSGTTAVVARYCGARDLEKAQKAVHTAVLLTVVLGVVFTIVGVGMTPTMLRLLKTPDDVYPEAYSYLVIYFGGIAAMLIYNMGAAILRAVGDTKRPSVYLVVSSVINVVLDLILVLVFDLGVAGVAWATVLSQVVSAVMVTAALMQADPLIRVQPGALQFHGESLRLIVGISIPSAIQFSITSFSNVFVQSYINQFGKYCMGGWTAFQKVDHFSTIPFKAVANATSTFVGQNLGAQKMDRVKQGIRTAMVLALLSAVTTSGIVTIFAEPLVRFFNDSEEIIYYGALFIRWITLFQVIHSVSQILTSALRGAGNTRVPMVIILSTLVGFRQLYLHVVYHYISQEIVPLAMAYPMGWLMAVGLLIVYYRHVGLERAVEKQRRKVWNRL